MRDAGILVVGGSIAATTALTTLLAEGWDGPLTLLSDEDRAPYTRVPLSKGVLSGRESAHDVALGDLGAAVDVRLRTAALGLDLGARHVVTRDGPVRYDGLIIATGARARRIGSADQDEVVLRSYDDGIRLRAEIATAASVVVVGGGVLGMEIASSCHTLGLAVTVVDVAPPLSRLLGPVAAEVVCGIATAAGVRCVVSPGGVRLVGSPRPHAVETSDGTLLEADLVVTAAGDVPNVEWLAGSGLRLDAGVVVDERCRAAPGVVAAGDVAVVAAGQRTPTWTSAVEQGRVAALALLRGEDGPVLQPSRYAWTDVFGLSLKLVGRPGPDGAPQVLAGSLEEHCALLAWPAGGATSTVLSFGHPTPVGRLKRMVPAR